VGDKGGWFGARVSRVLGDGKNTFFWFDNWIGDVPLHRRFGRLFDLATNKLISVADMFDLGWEERGEAWRWRRRLWTWEEEMLEACRLLLDGVSVQVNIIDRWQWDPDIHDGYTVQGAYQILTDLASSTIDTTRDLVWHKQVPLKVSIVAWCLLQDRLPTKSNLHRRDIILVEGDTCVSGCSQAESASHLFIHCDVFGSLWQHIRSWIGVSGVDPPQLN